MSQKEKALQSHHIFLVRHGDVDLASDICYGQLDCDVAESFEHDLSRLTKYFDVINMGNGANPIIISSPLTRCYQLAKGLTKHLNEQTGVVATLQCNKGFKEINFGEWEGNDWQSIGQDNINEWNDNFFDYCFPKGESARTFFKRVEAAWDTLLADLAEEEVAQTIIIVSHAGVIRSILTRFLDIPLNHSLTLTIDKMSVSSVRVVPEQKLLSRCLQVNHPI